MEFLLTLWNYVLPFLAVLTVLVFVHEMGHYLVARYCGVRIEVFSIGFGREIIGWNDKVGTRWKFSLFPIGGYVKMFGEMSAGPPVEAEQPGLPEEPDNDSFHTKTLGQRTAVVFAGPFANFLFAVVILTGMFMFVGQPYTPADINNVLPGSAAERAGMKPGDVIKSINGADIERFEQVIRIVQLTPGGALSIVVNRNGRMVALSAVADSHELTDRFGNTRKVGRLGVSRPGGDMKMVRHNPAVATWHAVVETATMTGNILDALWQIIAGTRSTEELGGPIRIAQMSGDMWASGLPNLIMFAAILSINLGLINLFPVPMLDGGHLLFYVYEAIRGKPLGERAQDFGFRIGIAMVLALMVFATWNDLVQLRVVDFIVELVT
ncbi:MAG: RIP metalloprotease RseP [Pseudomonadota bacterium]|nr:RIP metalloprotease RseP [Pseudomonadota bacterium]